ncbi:hypothetical protein Vadar_023443 [Vaccinium darrowii]|uniref:Uncharacterized protein n=1 Tax=Vaccinium darrowii TaxID=229202 RepID=A0ACB7Z5P1_9ERIC|nr:hypothetical protein Vadar_023443 [Vaccinium darrowii]
MRQHCGYSCGVSAEVAISKTNGIWIEDKKLFVKKATFEDQRINQRQRNNQSNVEVGKERESKFRKNDGGKDYWVHTGNNAGNFKIEHSSYADVLKGVPIRASKIVEAMESGADWLQRSVVGKLINHCHVNSLPDLFISNGI